MTDKQPSKAEIAQRLGITVADLEKQEAERRAALVKGLAEQGNAMLTPPRKQPDLLSAENLENSWKGLKGLLGLGLSAAFEKAAPEIKEGLEDAHRTSGTPNSVPNRNAERRMREAERPVTPPAP